MAASSDDKVPDLAAGLNPKIHLDATDGDTTAATVAPASQWPPSESEKEDRTVRRNVTGASGRDVPSVPRGALPPGRPPPAAPPRIASRRMTAVGLAPPPPTAATIKSPLPLPPREPSTEADRADDSITAASPSSPADSLLSRGLPRKVKISELDDDSDETAVKMLPSGQPAPVRAKAPIPAAGRPSTEDDDSVTTKAPVSDPRLLVNVKHPGDAYDPEESVTTRGPLTFEDDSVTEHVPVTRPPPSALQVPPSFDHGVAGSTQRLSKRSPVPPKDDDDEAETLTETAPSHLDNLLKAVSTPGGLGADVDNQTAVMPGAPVKPPHSPPRLIEVGSNGVAIADLRDSVSDSGLQVVRSEAANGDHASIGAILAAPTAEPGDVPKAANPFAKTEKAFLPGAVAVSPSGSVVALKKPRYGLIVALVALFSIAIPITLFLCLKGESPPSPQAPSEVVGGRIGRGDSVRSKGRPGLPAPSAQSSAKVPIGKHR